ncbi:MAG: DUF5647 family protein [Chloroflexota bacterium]
MKQLSRKDVAFNDRMFELTKQFNHLVFENPDMLDTMPERFILVLLDPDDEEFNRRSIELAKNMPNPPANAPLVYIRMKKHVRMVQQEEWQAEFITPSPLAA